MDPDPVDAGDSDPDPGPNPGACEEGKGCNDKDLCTYNDVCTDGVCAGTPVEWIGARFPFSWWIVR